MLRAVVLVVVVVSGCSFIMVRAPSKPDAHVQCESGAPVVDTAVAMGSVGIVAAMVIAGREEQANNPDDPFAGLDYALPAGIAGAAILPYAVSAIFGYQRSATCRRMKRDGEQIERIAIEQGGDAQATRVRAREQAWTWTKQAQVAARAGQCSEVFRLEALVRAADTDFLTSIFVRDRGIARCLWQTPAAR